MKSKSSKATPHVAAALLPKGFGPKRVSQQVTMSEAELAKLTEEKTEGAGFLYVIAHPSWPGKVKIGKTSHPDRRLGAYQVGCPMRAYTMVHSEWFPDAAVAEKKLLERLGCYRLHDSEWLTADSHFVVRAIKHLKTELMP